MRRYEVVITATSWQIRGQALSAAVSLFVH